MSEEPIKIRRTVEGNFSIVPDEIFENKYLSLQARALLAYMLGRPPNWTIYIRHILKTLHVSQSRWKSIRKELIDQKYFHQKLIKGKGVKFKWINIVTDCPTDSNTLLPTDSKKSSNEVSEEDTQNQNLNNKDSIDGVCANGNSVDGIPINVLHPDITYDPNTLLEDKITRTEEASNSSSARERSLLLCNQLKDMGIEKVNANNPKFLHLLDVESDDCFIYTAEECILKKIPRFEYMLGVIHWRRMEYKSLKPIV